LKDVQRDAEGGFSFPALGEGEIDFPAIFAALGPRSEVPLSLELPLRLRRRPDGRPWRTPQALELSAINDVVDRSRRYVLGLRDRGGPSAAPRPRP
jgi:sugar phosphate isomerase/epimerase